LIVEYWMDIYRTEIDITVNDRTVTAGSRVRGLSQSHLEQITPQCGTLISTPLSDKVETYKHAPVCLDIF
jgi:hypothetical protein